MGDGRRRGGYVYETIKDLKVIKFGPHLFRYGGGRRRGRMLIVLGGYMSQEWLLAATTKTPTMDPSSRATSPSSPLSIDLDLRVT